MEEVDPKELTKLADLISVGVARRLASPRSGPRPSRIYQLKGVTPDVAVLAFGKSEARKKIAVILGLKKLPPGSQVLRIR